ncbi:MAG: TetR/AcrR family transcriptional regulator [Anaerolineales bacterium]|nr:TetR/AcrR family transcriptional regulator [Anaerolineales bacterium]
MSPRPDVSEKRRAQILESAIQVIAQQGFANTRMDDVAAESGYSKGLLYWYFKSKEEIIIAIADLLFGVQFRKMQKLSVEGQTARACLENFLDIFLEDLRGMLKVAPVIYEFYALAFRNTTVRKVMQQYLERFVEILEPIVQQGMDNGEFTPGKARQITIAIGAALEGTLLLWAYAPEMFQPEEQLRASMALILKGLAA